MRKVRSTRGQLKKTQATINLVDETSTVSASAPIVAPAPETELVIDIQATKVTEALATMEIGVKEPAISMDIDVRAAEKPVNATFVNAALYKILSSDHKELE